MKVKLPDLCQEKKTTLSCQDLYTEKRRKKGKLVGDKEKREVSQ